MSGIPDSHQEPNPEMQQVLDFLCERPNQQFTLDQIAQGVGKPQEEVQIRLEALEYQGEIKKDHPQGGAAVYFRPQRT